MANTSTIEYCTDRAVQDIFPHLAEYDLKKRLYNFQVGISNAYDTTLDVYYLGGSGLVTELFIDGSKADKITDFNTTVATLAEDVSAAALSDIDITLVGGTTALAAEDIIKIDNEYIQIAAMSDSTTIVTGSRGELGSGAKSHSSGTAVKLFIDASIDVQDADSTSDAPSYVYDSDVDKLVIISDTDINNNIIESGDDWTTIKTRFRRKASRLIESHLDNRLSREVLKDREGNYPEIIVHATALQSVILLLRAHDPNSEVVESFKDELNEILEGLKAGSIVLPTAVSGDSSKGVIREVSVNSASDLRPIELQGHYNGTGYELIKVYIDTDEGGIIGTSKMTVLGKSTASLKAETIINSEIITGDFQNLGIGNMKIRWSGDNVINAITTAGDEYEIECWGAALETTISSTGSVRMTRR